MSPMTVIGDSTYIADVECALGKICPGVRTTNCTADPDGILTCTVDVSDVHCPGYCAHRAGCNLILAVSEAGDVTIEDGGSFKYFHLDEKIWWWCEWTIEDDCGECGRSGGGLLNPIPLLAHELVHAYHDLVTGTYESISYSCDYPEEECTICATNQVRDELQMPRRCTYGKLCVRCGPRLYRRLKNQCGYECYLIPTESEVPGCECATPITEAFLQGQSYLHTVWDWLSLAVEAILELLTRPFVRKKSPSPIPPFDEQEDAEARMGDDDFGELVPREPDKAKAYEEALEVLARGRRKWSHPRAEATFDAASHALSLEVVAMPAGYRTLLLTVEGDNASLITSFEPSRNESGPRLGSQGDLVLHDLGEADDDLRRIFEEDTFWGADGQEASVEPEVSDGDADFLRVKTNGRIKKVALKGFAFPTGPRSDRARPADPTDASRWDAVRRAFEVGAEQVDAVVGPGVVLRRGPAHVSSPGSGGCCC